MPGCFLDLDHPSRLGFTVNPKSRLRRHRSGPWLLASAVAIVLLAFFGPRFLARSGPLYLGQGPSYWFPRWTFEFAWSQADELKRAKTLGQAGPEALPMLASAAKVEERPSFLRYKSLRQKVPSYIAQFILPVYRGTDITHFNMVTHKTP